MKKQKQSKYVSRRFDPNGSYTGNYSSCEEENERPVQDADDL